MHLGVSSICQGHSTKDKPFRLTTLNRGWGGDQTFRWVNFSGKKKKKRHPLSCPGRPVEFFCKAGFRVRCNAIDILPVPSPHAALGARPLSKGALWNWRERLGLFPKMTFSASKPLTAGWFSFPFGIVAFPLNGLLSLSPSSLCLTQMVVREMWM